jgi:hypothetical protein
MADEAFGKGRWGRMSCPEKTLPATSQATVCANRTVKGEGKSKAFSIYPPKRIYNY